MQILCPSGGKKARVFVAGTTHTMCVHGSLPAFLLPRAEAAPGIEVRVRVFDGHIASPAAPNPMDPDERSATITGQTWSVVDIPVPAFAAEATTRNLTAVAWLLSGGMVQANPGVQFVGATAGHEEDCCPGSGSVPGSSPGRGAMAAQLTDEMGAAAELQVTVPDGKNAGIHTARAVAVMTWEARLNGGTIRLSVGSCGTLRLSSGGARSVPAAAVELAPFSAVFPGDLLGAAGDVVVIVA